jgi:glycosyltransferase involved in cell wall biosynthesis
MLSGLVFVGDPCHDHSDSSGYHQLCSLFPQAGWLGAKALAEGELSWHRRPGDLDRRPAVFHVLYGDCSHTTLPAILRRRFPSARIVSTAHQPAARLRRDAAVMASLRVADVIVTVSGEQARLLAGDHGVGVPVCAIPHGVWVSRFRLSPESIATPRTDVLLVGRHLRDWDGARYVLDALAGHGIRSVVLGAFAAAHLPRPHALVDLRGRVSEADLARLYDRSAVLFLPLLDGTASNAVLEAMAAGCPVVCPDIGSLVEEYLGDRLDAFEPGRYDAAVGRILGYVRSPAHRSARSNVLAQRAEQFDWACLRPRYERLYRAVVQ